MANGSFLSEDSYLGTQTEPLSRNRYTYVSNNPINYVDPSGHLLEMLFNLTNGWDHVKKWASNAWDITEIYAEELCDKGGVWLGQGLRPRSCYFSAKE